MNNVILASWGLFKTAYICARKHIYPPSFYYISADIFSNAIMHFYLHFLSTIFHEYESPFFKVLSNVLLCRLLLSHITMFMMGWIRRHFWKENFWIKMVHAFLILLAFAKCQRSYTNLHFHQHQISPSYIIGGTVNWDNV